MNFVGIPLSVSMNAALCMHITDVCSITVLYFVLRVGARGKGAGSKKGMGTARSNDEHSLSPFTSDHRSFGDPCHNLNCCFLLGKLT